MHEAVLFGLKSFKTVSRRQRDVRVPDACTLPNRQSEIVSLMDDVDADSVLVVFHEKGKKLRRLRILVAASLKGFQGLATLRL